MKKEPDIVKELREAEKLGLLQSKAESIFITPRNMHSSQNNAEQFSPFIDKVEGWDFGEVYRNIVEQAVVGVVISKDGKVVFCNKKESEIFGYEKPSDMYGKNVSDLVHKDDIAWLVNLAEELKSGRASPHPVIFRGIRADGKEIYIEGYAIPFLSYEGSISILSFHIDITERKKEEERFKDQESKYRLIAENTSDLIALTTFSLNPKYTYVSPSHERVMGYKPDELIGKPAFDFIHPDDKKKLRQIAKKYVVSKGKKIFTGRDEIVTETLEFRIKDKSGKWRYLESTANIVGNELLFVSRDVTERKQMMDIIRENEEKYRTIFENVNDEIIYVDKYGKVIDVNPRIKDIFGYEPEDVIGKNFTKLGWFKIRELPKVIKLFKNALKGNIIDLFELEVKHKDGHIIPVEISTKPVIKNNKIVGFLSIVRDVSERKKAQEEIKYLKEYNEKVLESNPNPLIIIKGYLVEYVNNAFVSTFGKTKNDYVLKDIREVVPSFEIISAYYDTLRSLNGEKEIAINDKIFLINSFVVTKSEEEEEEELRVGIIFQDVTEYRKIEEELKESHNKLDTLLNAAADGIRIVNRDFTVKTLNDTMAKLAGVDKETAVGMKCSEMFNSDACGTENCSIVRAIREGKTFSRESIRKSSDGKTIPCLEVVTPLRDAYGNIIGIIEDFRDISEIKKVEQKLRESEEKFRIISEAAYDAIIMLDNQGKVSYWNKAAEKMFGYKSKEIIGKELHRVLPPEEYYMPYKKGFEEFKHTGKGPAVGRTIELPAIKKDGTEIIAELSLSSVKIKGKWNAIGIVRDITEKKQIEKEIKIRDEAIKSSINGIAITDSMGNIIYVNNSFLKMWKVDTAEEVLGKPIVNFWEVNENYRKVMSNLVKTGGWTGELIAKRKNGSTFPVQLSINFITDENNRINNIFASFVDITEQKKAEEEIKRKQERIEKQNIQLKKLDKIKSEFLNITSHELRTPMSAIKGYAQMMLKEVLGPTTDEQKKALNVVIRNINRLDNLIRDILDVSRLESGTMRFLPEKVDIKEMISDVVETMQSFAETKKIQIKTEIQENLPNLFVDPERIKQVIINIVNNAIKFSPHNSIIIIRVKRDKKDKVLFEIQDFGKGIPKNKQKKIFETFYQVDSGIDRKFGGAGLGLAISRGIILSHGGKIWVNSKLGEGSTFKFTLPIKPVIDHEERFREADIFGLKLSEKDIENN